MNFDDDRDENELPYIAPFFENCELFKMVDVTSKLGQLFLPKMQYAKYKVGAWVA